MTSPAAASRETQTRTVQFATLKSGGNCSRKPEWDVKPHHRNILNEAGGVDSSPGVLLHGPAFGSAVEKEPTVLQRANI